MEIITDALATGADPNLSDAFTINGQPGYLYDCSNTTAFRMLVDYGKTYLLRIISVVMNEEMFYGAEVELIWQGTNVGVAENHPMHLHGYSFYVVGVGDGNFDKKTSPSTYNLVDPPLVNTIGC